MLHCTRSRLTHSQSKNSIKLLISTFTAFAMYLLFDLWLFNYGRRNVSIHKKRYFWWSLEIVCSLQQPVMAQSGLKFCAASSPWPMTSKRNYVCHGKQYTSYELYRTYISSVIRAVPEIILGGQWLFCPEGGYIITSSLSWGTRIFKCGGGSWYSNLSWGWAFVPFRMSLGWKSKKIAAPPPPPRIIYETALRLDCTTYRWTYMLLLTTWPWPSSSAVSHNNIFSSVLKTVRFLFISCRHVTLTFNLKIALWVTAAVGNLHTKLELL